MKNSFHGLFYYGREEFFRNFFRKWKENNEGIKNFFFFLRIRNFNLDFMKEDIRRKIGGIWRMKLNLLKFYCEEVKSFVFRETFKWILKKEVEEERYGKKKFKVKGRIRFDVLLINLFFFVSITIICI